MIVGQVNRHEEPIISLTLLIKGSKRRFKAIIDTGFNGYLSVPFHLAKDWYFFGHEKYEIATGDVVEEKVFLGRMIWNHRSQDVYAVTSHSKDILLGTKLLRQNQLIIDFRRKKVVIR